MAFQKAFQADAFQNDAFQVAASIVVTRLVPARPAAYQLRLKDTSGASVVAVTDHFERLAFTKRVNSPGFYILQMGEFDPFLSDLGLDYQLEVWRRIAGVDWYLEFEAFHRTITYQRTLQGKAIATSYGVGYADLLRRRILAGYAGTAFTAKSGPAETVAKEFVDEQCVSGAIFREIAGLTIEADGGRGAIVELNRAWRILLEVLQEVSLMAEQKGDPGDWAVVGTGDAAFEFRWYHGQLGEDRRVGNIEGNPPIVFSMLLGNMALPIYALARTDEGNAIYVGGQGEGVGRALEIRTDAVAVADSPWNRREMFADARNEDTVAALQDKGDSKLEERQAEESFSFEVIQTTATVYGRDYFLGDLVTARYGDIERSKKIVGVRVVVQENRETISLEVADVP